MFVGVLLWNNSHSDNTCYHNIDSALSPVHHKTSNHIFAADVTYLILSEMFAFIKTKFLMNKQNVVVL